MKHLTKSELSAVYTYAQEVASDANVARYLEGKDPTMAQIMRDDIDANMQRLAEIMGCELVERVSA